jgi:hypothetical protein
MQFKPLTKLLVPWLRLLLQIFISRLLRLLPASRQLNVPITPLELLHFSFAQVPLLPCQPILSRQPP